MKIIKKMCEKRFVYQIWEMNKKFSFAHRVLEQQQYYLILISILCGAQSVPHVFDLQSWPFIEEPFALSDLLSQKIKDICLYFCIFTHPTLVFIFNRGDTS